MKQDSTKSFVTKNFILDWDFIQFTSLKHVMEKVVKEKVVIKPPTVQISLNSEKGWNTITTLLCNCLINALPNGIYDRVYQNHHVFMCNFMKIFVC